MTITQEEKYKIQSVVDLFTSFFNFEMNGKTLETLIVQGGMGVDVSGVKLGTAIGETGSMGTVSTTLSIYKKKLENLDHSLLIGINNLVATIDYEENYALGEQMGADFIASGAGFTPNVGRRAKDQISLLGEKHYWTIPIISNISQLKKRIPLNWGYIILENTDSGGHNGEGLGYEGTLEEYRGNPVDKGANKVIYAGGVRTPADFVKVIDHGFDAVQMGTVFLGSIEADFKPQYKEMIINAGEPGIPDVTRVPSVAGLAASGFPIGVIEGVLKGEQYKRHHCVDKKDEGCLMNCNNIKLSAEKINLADIEKLGNYCIRDALRAITNESNSNYPPLVFSGMHPEKLLLKEWLPDRKPIPASEIVAKFLIGAYDSIIDGSFKTPGFNGKITDEHRNFLENKFNLYQKNENQTLTAKILQAA